jgi:hypothetical protein
MTAHRPDFYDALFEAKIYYLGLAPPLPGLFWVMAVLWSPSSL